MLDLLMGSFRLTFSLFVMLGAISHVCLGQTLKVGGYDYPPFMDSKTQSGLYVELTNAIEQHSQLTFNWVFYPYARVDHLFNLGDVQVEIGSSPLWNQHKETPGLFSMYFYELEDVAVFHEKSPKRARNHDDIQGQKIGIVRGYSFPQFADAFQNSIAYKIEGNNEKQLLHLLLNRRIDQVFMSKHVLLNLKKQHPEYNNLVFKDVVGKYEVAIRVHPNHQDVIPQLNQAIQTLKQKNIIQKIFEKAQ